MSEEISREEIAALLARGSEEMTSDVFDEYGNYRYPSDVELIEPNTATSMPCEDAISRQAAIDMLEKHQYSLEYCKEHGIDYSVDIGMARIVLKDLPSVTPKHRWIPVSERLPNECIKVLVWERYYSYKRERYVYDYNFGWLYDEHWFCEGGGESKVFAWMPLPEPYTAESEEQA